MFQRVCKSVYLMAIYINKVTRMDYMFTSADSFNRDINDWNTAQVTNRLSEPTASATKTGTAWTSSGLRGDWDRKVTLNPLGIHYFQELVFFFADATHVRSTKCCCRSPLGPSDLDSDSDSAFDWSPAIF